ncbi:MAG: TfoX/Sxy family protein [Deltaproteobacteria bacterium]|jgi:TfoX/Sxy family transcriptional regulator of competence genes|nr:TfoX/Sxy family protein [Deltaproteobacteria bacterium]
MAYDEKTAERVRNLLSIRSDVVEKKLMGGLCFMVNGAMCCSVSSRGGLLVRVGAQAQEPMLGDPHVRPMEMAGRTMTGFVRVIPEGYRTEAALAKWIQLGVDFVETLGGEKRRRRSQRDLPNRRRIR